MKKYLVPFVILFGFVLSACSFSLAADVTPPPGSSAPVITPETQNQPISGPLYPLVAPNPTAGKAIYLEKCEPCHGARGLGDGERAAGLPNPVAAIGTSELARAASPAQWYTTVSQGNLERFMPPFPSLNDRQRWDVVAYAYTLSQTPAEVDQAKGLYLAECAACHGETGKGDGPQAGDQAMANFTDQAFMADQTASDLYQAITSSETHAQFDYGNKLSDDQRWGLADYLRSLTFASSGELAAATPSPALAGPTAEVATPVVASEVVTPTVSTGIVSGLVTNGSGGEIPVGAEVMLHGFDQMQMAITQTATVGADGQFTFNDVAMPDGRMFFASLQHQDTTFGSDIATVTSGMTNIDLPITVYDTTQDTSGLKIDRLHLFFELVDPQTMRVAELMVMSNDSGKAIVSPADGQPVVTFNLPAGYQNLQFQNGELGGRFVETAQGFGDTTTIYPGQGNYQVLLAYDLPYNRKLQLNQTQSLQTDAVVILVPQQSFNVKGDNLQDAGTRDMGGMIYQMYNLNALKPGEQLNLTVSTGASLIDGSKQGIVIGLGALGLALILGGVWLYWRNRDRRVDQEDEESGPAEPGENCETEEELMDAILALDDLFASGQISEEAYLERRAELKDRLKQIVEK